MRHTRHFFLLLLLVSLFVFNWSGFQAQETTPESTEPVLTDTTSSTSEPSADMTEIVLPADTATAEPTEAAPTEITAEVTGAATAPAETTVQVETTEAATQVPEQTQAPPESTAAPAEPPLDEWMTVSIPPDAVANQLVISFAETSSPQEQQAYLRQLGARTVREIPRLQAVVVELPDQAVSHMFHQSPVLRAVQPNYQVTALTDDPLYPQQWGLDVIGAPEAWLALPVDVPNVTVAVIDSGICAAHPDLQGRILAGWDFVENDAIPQDDFGHGCAVAGVIAANTDNGQGIAGAAPNAQIMPLRVLDSSGRGDYATVAAAIVYAVDNAVPVINLSLGGSSPSTVLEDAVNYAVEHGVMLVAAAGNTGGTVLYPAAYPSVIAVAAIDPDLQLSSFSSRGPEIDLLAPGRDILTTTKEGDYGLFSGTSFAAPHVAAAAVLEMALGGNLTLDGGIVAVTVPSTPDAVTATPAAQPLTAEPALIAIVSEPFLTEDIPDWTLGEGWQLAAQETGFALQVSDSNAPVTYNREQFADLAVEMLFQAWQNPFICICARVKVVVMT